MMKNTICFIVLFLTTFTFLKGQSNPDAPVKTDKKTTSKAKWKRFLDKRVDLRILLMGNYAYSLTDGVDISGTHNPDNANNAFYLRYARFKGKFHINNKLLIQLLFNLADFKKDPRTKVLEIAALKWKINPYVNLQLGQFRPYFGLEDRCAIEAHKSYTWSKQYSLMGKCNWQSFQIGTALYGSLKEKNIPLRYFYSIYNGNGKNRLQDDDNAKNHAFRLEYNILPDLQLGVNMAFTNVENQNASIYGVDVKMAQKISKSWKFELNSEYKIGANIYDFKASTLSNKDIDDFQLEGFYIIPSLSGILDAEKNIYMELSMRYEYLSELKNGNTEQFLTPMISYVIDNDFLSKISLIGVISNYDKDVSGTSKYDSNLLLFQYLLKF